MDSWPTLAAVNNAEWCDLVSQSHGARTRVDADAWTSSTRTPRLYPDAVTLAPSPSVPDLLSRIDTSAGCSIKDSFANLDLSSDGFLVLFEAEWIVRSGSAPPPPFPVAEPTWKRVSDASGLAAWERAWRGDAGPADLFRPDLLEAESVAVLGAYADERVVAGAVLNHGSTVVGVSNFFMRTSVEPATGAGWLALTAELFPGCPVVGYESGDDLISAQRLGFEVTGPLRVWIKDG